jgi:hypothetical protein
MVPIHLRTVKINRLKEALKNKNTLSFCVVFNYPNDYADKKLCIYKIIL